jgi:uncharacterized membrane protein (DUF441 family)
VRFLRSLLAIGAGFAVFALVVGVLTPVATRRFGVENFQSFSMALLFATLAYSVVAAAVAGYLTAYIAGQRELPHAAALGMLIIGMGFVSMREHGLKQPGWYEATIAGCGPMAALFGAGLRRLRKR